MKMQIQNVPIVNERHDYTDSGNKNIRFVYKNYLCFPIYAAVRESEDDKAVVGQPIPERG